MAGWILDSQAIKPQNAMPSYRNLDPDALEHILDYLQGLQ
jgi:hypothetical protein